MSKKATFADALKALAPRKSRVGVIERFPAQARELLEALEGVASGKLPRLSMLQVCEVFLTHHPEITGLTAHALRNWVYKRHHDLYARVLK